MQETKKINPNETRGSLSKSCNKTREKKEREREKGGGKKVRNSLFENHVISFPLCWLCLSPFYFFLVRFFDDQRKKWERGHQEGEGEGTVSYVLLIECKNIFFKLNKYLKLKQWLHPSKARQHRWQSGCFVSGGPGFKFSRFHVM